MLLLAISIVFLSLVSASNVIEFTDLPRSLIERILDSPGAKITIRDIANLKMTTKYLYETLDISDAAILYQQFDVDTRKPRTAYNLLLKSVQVNRTELFLQVYDMLLTFPLNRRFEMPIEYIFALSMAAVRHQNSEILQYLAKKRHLSGNLLKRAYHYAINLNLNNVKQTLDPFVKFPINDLFLSLMGKQQSNFIRAHQFRPFNCTIIQNNFDLALQSSTIDVNSFYPFNATQTRHSPVMLAIECSNLTLARQLIRHGADIRYYANTAVPVVGVGGIGYADAATLATYYGHVDFLRELYNLGLPFNSANAISSLNIISRFPNYRNFLHLYMDHGTTGQSVKSHLLKDQVKYIERGQVDHFTGNFEFIHNIRIASNESASVLCHDHRSRPDVIRILWKIDSKTGLSEPVHTIVHLAAKSNNADMMRIILECGFNPDFHTFTAPSPLQYAETASKLNAAKALVDGGASLDSDLFLRLLIAASGLKSNQAAHYELVEALLRIRDRFEQVAESVTLVYCKVLEGSDNRVKNVFIEHGFSLDPAVRC